MNLLSNFNTSGLRINTLNTTDNILKIINSAGDVGSISPASLIAAGGGVTGSGTNGQIALWGASGLTGNAAFLWFSGTTPYLKIDNGTGYLNLGIDASAGSSVLYNTNTFHRFLVQSGGIEALRISDNGNVGIGTTTPTEKLDVNGNVRVVSPSAYTGTFPTTANLQLGSNAFGTTLHNNGSTVEMAFITYGVVPFTTVGYAGLSTLNVPIQGTLNQSAYLQTSNTSVALNSSHWWTMRNNVSRLVAYNVTNGLDIGTTDATQKVRFYSTYGAVATMELQNNTITIPSFGTTGIVTNTSGGVLGTTTYADLGAALATSTNYWTKTGSDLSYTAGKVGIGATPGGAKLTIYDPTGYHLEFRGGTNWGYIGTDGTIMQFGATSSADNRITQNLVTGNVTIGTSVLGSEKLTVAGTISSGIGVAHSGRMILRGPYSPAYTQGVVTEYSSGAIGLATYMYQDGGASWLSGYGAGPTPKSALIVNGDALNYWCAPVDNVAYGAALTTQPVIKFSVNGSGIIRSAYLAGTDARPLVANYAGDIMASDFDSFASSTNYWILNAPNIYRQSKVFVDQAGIGAVGIDADFRVVSSNGAGMRVNYAGTGDNYYDAASGSHHYFRTGGAERMTINGGSGFVGIGTTSPVVKLESVGVIAASTSTYDGVTAEAIRFSAPVYPSTYFNSIRSSISVSASGNKLEFSLCNGTSTGQTVALRMYGDGNIDVPGLTTAGYVTNQSDGRLGTVTAATLGAALNYWTLSGSNVYRATGNAAVGRNSTSGYWAAGTGFHEASFLTAYSDAATTINTAKAGMVIFNSDQTQANMSVLAFGTNQSDPNAVAPSAIYGIHTPNSVRTTGYNSGAIGFATVNSPTGFGLIERMRISQEGNVGIGTALPNSKLTVNGDVTVSGPAGPIVKIARQDVWNTTPLQIMTGTSVDFQIEQYNSLAAGTNYVALALQNAQSLIINSGLNNSKSLVLQSSNLQLKSGNYPYLNYMDFDNVTYQPYGVNAMVQTDGNIQLRSQSGQMLFPVNHTEIGTAGAYWTFGRTYGNSDELTLSIQQAGAYSWSPALKFVSSGTAAAKTFVRTEFAGGLRINNFTTPGHAVRVVNSSGDLEAVSLATLGAITGTGATNRIALWNGSGTLSNDAAMTYVPGVSATIGKNHWDFATPGTAALSASNSTMMYRDVYASVHASGATGALVIEFPTTDAQFQQWKIKGINYGTIYTPWELTITFYYYNGGFPAANAVVSGNPNFERLRLAMKGGKIQLIIGETSTAWTDGSIVVSEGMVTTSVGAPQLSGWSSSYVTDLTAYTPIGDVGLYPIKLTVQENNQSEVHLKTNGFYDAKIVAKYDSGNVFYIQSLGSNIFGNRNIDGAGYTKTFVNGRFGIGFSVDTDSPTVASDYAMFVHNNKKVGIGTIAPTEKLTVAGQIGVSTSGYTVNPTTANFGLYTGGTTPTSYIQAPNAGDVAIWNAGTSPIATFKASGDVGIGTNAPVKQVDIVGTGGNSTLRLEPSLGNLYEADIEAKYDVANSFNILSRGNQIFGTKAITGTTGGAQGTYVHSYYDVVITTGATTPLTDASNARVWFKQDGKVGIGIAAPSYLLHVNGTLSSGNATIVNAGAVPTLTINNSQPLNNGYIQFQTSGTAKWTTGMGVTTAADQYLIYSHTLGGAVITALANGNTGINGNAPTTNLHVFGTDTYAANTDGQFTISDATTPLKKMTMGFDITNNFGYINTIYQGASIMPLVLNPQGGNVGIGITTPDYLLTVAEDANINGNIIGKGPGSASGNFTFATYSAITNKTGTNNIFVGADAGKLLTSGSQNIFLGNFAGRDNVTGVGNVCLGQQAGKVYTSNSMTAVGNFTLQSATQPNTAFGASALQYVTSGGNNIGLGGGAGSSGTAGKNLETGSYNTFVGPQAGFGIVSGSYNVVIGRTVTELAAALSNNVIIGDGQGNVVFHASPTNVKSFIGGALRLDVKSDGRVRIPAIASEPTGLEEGDTWMSTTEKREGQYIDGKKKFVMYREDILDTKNFLLREDFLKTNNVPTLWAYAGDTVSLTSTSAQYGYGGFAVTTDTVATSTNGFANLYQDADFKVDTSIYDYFFEFLFDPTNPPNPTNTGEIYLGVGGTSSQMSTIAVPDNFVGFKIHPDGSSSYRYSYVRRSGGTETSASSGTIVTSGVRRLGVKWTAGRLIFYENGVELLNTTTMTNVPTANTLLRLKVKSITAVSAPVEIGGIVASAAIQFSKL